MNTESLLKAFRASYYESTGIQLDFRKHSYLDNQHGLTPCFDYNFAVDVITSLYDWAHTYIADNACNYPHFEGWKYNLDMTCDGLRTGTLKSLLSDVMLDLYLNHVDEYRKEGSKLYRYDASARAYIYCASKDA